MARKGSITMSTIVFKIAFRIFTCGSFRWLIECRREPS